MCRPCASAKQIGDFSPASDNKTSQHELDVLGELELDRYMQDAFAAVDIVSLIVGNVDMYMDPDATRVFGRQKKQPWMATNDFHLMVHR
jgi:hypothetical protein